MQTCLQLECMFFHLAMKSLLEPTISLESGKSQLMPHAIWIVMIPSHMSSLVSHLDVDLGMFFEKKNNKNIQTVPSLRNAPTPQTNPGLRVAPAASERNERNFCFCCSLKEPMSKPRFTKCFKTKKCQGHEALRN